MNPCPHPSCPMCRAKLHREENRRLKAEGVSLRRELQLVTGPASRTARVERALTTWHLKPWPNVPEAKFARDNAIYMAVEGGGSFKAVGEHFKLRAPRVKDIWLRQAKEKDLITVSFKQMHADGVALARARSCLRWVAHRLGVEEAFHLPPSALLGRVESALKAAKIELPIQENP